MKIGIISDSHDNIWNMDKAFEILKEQEVAEVIHCGDFCAPFSVARLDNIGVPVHCVYGNTDDREMNMKKAEESKNIKLYGRVAEFEIDGKSFAVNHFPNIASALAATGKYDVVCFGHTHQLTLEDVNGTILVNPGEIAGVKNPPTLAIYDTESNEVKFINL